MTFEGNAKDGKSVQTLHKPKVPKNITIFCTVSRLDSSKENLGLLGCAGFVR